MSLLLKYNNCFIAGAFAAAGSVFGKLPSYLEQQDFVLKLKSPERMLVVYLDIVLVRLLPYVLMFVCNVLNWRHFLFALQTTDHTLIATVLTAGTNYTISFILGYFVYDEPITILSSFGLTLILAGLWYLCEEVAPKMNDQTNTNVKQD